MNHAEEIRRIFIDSNRNHYDSGYRVQFYHYKKIADLGLVTINQKETHLIHWPPFIRAILLGIGIVLLIIDKNILNLATQTIANRT